MKLFACHWLAASSLLVGSLAHADTRPQYGGTLRIAMRATPSTLDPADSRVPDSFARRNLASLLFDTLVILDDAGRVRPGLADSWLAAKGNQRWQFRLRRGIKFHDAMPLTSEIVAASLRFANPSWNVKAEGDTLIVNCDEANPEMLAELALSRNAIVKRDAENLSGTGPFHIVDWQPGKRLTLGAEEDCWRGRPFLDGIEVEMGRSFRDQITALEVGRVDVVEIAPDQGHHFSRAKGRLLSSAPVELLALVFTRGVSSTGDKALREALGLSIERGSMLTVLLQGTGQPTGGLLPTWISGYGFVFPIQADLPKARQLRAKVHSNPTWTIGYEASDPLARLLAERIALNAKDASLSLQPAANGSSDLRLLRVPLEASDPWIALESVTVQTGLPFPKRKGDSAENLYQAEQSALADERVIPLFHLPVSYASAPSLKQWAVRADGSLDLSAAWLESRKP
jgi:ABC-type transport system substrate-binding protein